MEANEKIRIQNLDLYYGDFHALKNINLEIREKQITSFIGPSGCGKSTLLIRDAASRGRFFCGRRN